MMLLLLLLSQLLWVFIVINYITVIFELDWCLILSQVQPILC